LIADMARANQTWGEERIVAELLLKLGIVVSPRTVRRYMQRPIPSRPSSSSQTRSTFVRNHAHEKLACDFFVTVTATFRLVYVFLVLAIGTRRILQWNVTEHPTAEWTVQQFRSCVPGHGRPHSSLAPGIPEPSGLTASRAVGHELPQGHRVAAKPILGGLHHEYRLERVAA
jgi:hypothetical protein